MYLVHFYDVDMVLQNQRHSRRRLPKSKDQIDFLFRTILIFPVSGNPELRQNFPGIPLDLMKMLQWPDLMIIVNFVGKRYFTTCLLFKIRSEQKIETARLRLH